MTSRYVLLAGLALLLTACADEKKDYDAQANCQNIGLAPGTKAYEDCVSDEKTVKLMEQQRREYEEMKQQQEDWRLKQNR